MTPEEIIKLTPMQAKAFHGIIAPVRDAVSRAWCAASPGSKLEDKLGKERLHLLGQAHGMYLHSGEADAYIRNWNPDHGKMAAVHSHRIAHLDLIKAKEETK